MRRDGVILFFVVLLVGVSSGCWGAATWGLIEIGDDDGSKAIVTGVPPTTFSHLTPGSGGISVADNPTFRWVDADGETGYVLEIADNPLFTPPFVYTDATIEENQTLLTIPTGILSDATMYHWRVRATNAFGWSTPATGSSFTVQLVPWSTTYGTSDDEAVVKAYPTADGGYVLFGNRTDDFLIIKLHPDTTIEWEMIFGAGGTDVLRDVRPTSDGGYVLCGYTDQQGPIDYWVVKFRSDWTVEWQKTYGGPAWDTPVKIWPAVGGGYYVIGETTSFDLGNGDAWIVKLFSDGSVDWAKAFGDTFQDNIFTGVATSDGGVAFGGWSLPAVSFDYWIIKLLSDGSVDWENRYDSGASVDDVLGNIRETPDGGFIMAGSNDFLPAGSPDAWIVKITSTGAPEWQRTYGGTGPGDNLTNVVPTSDGGYILSGFTQSFGAGANDAWVVKLFSNGTIEWQKSFGFTTSERALFVEPLSTGGFLVGGDVPVGLADDMWLMNLPSGGEVLLPDLGPDTTASTSATGITVSGSSATMTNTVITPQDTNATPRSPIQESQQAP